MNGVQPPSFHAKNALHNGILPLHERVDYVFNEYSSPHSTPGLVAIVGICGIWGPTLEQLRADFVPSIYWNHLTRRDSILDQCYESQIIKGKLLGYKQHYRHGVMKTRS